MQLVLELVTSINTIRTELQKLQEKHANDQRNYHLLYLENTINVGFSFVTTGPLSASRLLAGRYTNINIQMIEDNISNQRVEIERLNAALQPLEMQLKHSSEYTQLSREMHEIIQELII